MSKDDLATGVILAGGLSRRMGGGDKGLVDIGGKTMLAHVVERLRPQVGQLILNANGDPKRFAAFGLPVVGDTVAGFAGPLAGILAGMRWASAHTPHARCIVTATSDVPFLPSELVTRLEAAIGDRREAIALAQSDDGLHPVIGLWPVALAGDLECQLAAGVRKMLQWTDRHETIPVLFEPSSIGGHLIDPFFNVNTPADLEVARALLADKTPQDCSGA